MTKCTRRVEKVIGGGRCIVYCIVWRKRGERGRKEEAGAVERGEEEERQRRESRGQMGRGREER